MLLRTFKSGQPGMLALIPVMAGLIWLKYFIVPQPVSMVYEPHSMPFYSWISSLLDGRLILGKLLTICLLVLNALWLARINTKYILLQHRTYLPAAIYIVIVSAYLPLQQLNPAAFASLFLVYSIDIMFRIYKKEELALEFFQAAFLVGIASLFYARSAILMLVVWSGLSLFRTFHWREWAFTFLGFVTPYVILFSWYYLSGQNIAENWEGIRYNFAHDRGTGYLNIYYLGFYAYLFLLILLASRKMIGTYQNLKIYIRKFFRLNFWIFVFVLAAYGILYSRAIEMIYFAAIPVSYILSYFFLNMRTKIIGEIIFAILLAACGALLYFN